jgi:glycerol-3-phosphate dehydrogenase
MKRTPLSEFAGRTFDVMVVGAGVSGASAAQHLAAAGFAVFLADAEDYGSGASSRSSRLMHFGLRYLDRGEPLINYFKNPLWFIKQCRRARNTMRHRAEVVRTTPERLKPFTMYIPVFKDDHFRPWQMSAALRLINALGGSELPVDWSRVAAGDWSSTPLLGQLRDQDRLKGAFSLVEYQYDWPERMVIDCVNDARRMGAVCRNHTRVTGLANHGPEKWSILLCDGFNPSDQVEINARQVLNMAGPWIDRVLQTANRPVSRQIAGMKGAHIVFRLPERFRGHGVAHFARNGYPIYCLPWRDLHFVGPTETEFSGDPAHVRVTREDAAYLLSEANHFLPGLDIKAEDILFCWAGVRPNHYDPGYKYSGKKNFLPEYRDHGTEGLPNLMSVPGVPLMLHRFVGRRIAREVARRITPSGPAQTVSYGTRRFEQDTNSPPVNASYPEIRLSHLEDMAREEQPACLADLLFRRAGLGWTGDMSRASARRAAEAVAAIAGWDEAAIEAQLQAFDRHVLEHFLAPAQEEPTSEDRPATSRANGTVVDAGATAPARPVGDDREGQEMGRRAQVRDERGRGGRTRPSDHGDA